MHHRRRSQTERNFWLVSIDGGEDERVAAVIFGRIQPYIHKNGFQNTKTATHGPHDGTRVPCRSMHAGNTPLVVYQSHYVAGLCPFGARLLAGSSRPSGAYCMYQKAFLWYKKYLSTTVEERLRNGYRWSYHTDHRRCLTIGGMRLG
jgi:hypothetical protein